MPLSYIWAKVNDANQADKLMLDKVLRINTDIQKN